MIAIKYAKRYPLSMISQSDMLNVIKRILTRAGVKVEYSAGFNPHMLLYFSARAFAGHRERVRIRLRRRGICARFDRKTQ